MEAIIKVSILDQFLDYILQGIRIISCLGSAPQVTLPPPSSIAPPVAAPEKTALVINDSADKKAKKRIRLSLRNDQIRTDISLPAPDNNNYV